MSITLNMGVWNNVFAVPKSLISNHLKLCSGNELKLILWLLANTDKSCTKEMISSDTGIPLSCIDDCLEYWTQENLIISDNNELSPKPSTITPSPIETPTQNIESKPMNKMLRPDSIYIAKRLNESLELTHLFHSIESVLGKTLSPSLCSVLIILHDDYCLAPEVIMMLISYCVSIERTSTAFIETLAKKWYNDGINSLELAEEAIKNLDKKITSWKKLVSIIGIPYRKPIKSEEELAVFAVIEMKFSDDMIKLCFDKCIEGTGKFQAKYMRKIFESWGQRNFKSVSDIDMYESNKKSTIDNKRDTSYDLNEFHKLNLFNLEDESDEL